MGDNVWERALARLNKLEHAYRRDHARRSGLGPTLKALYGRATDAQAEVKGIVELYAHTLNRLFSHFFPRGQSRFQKELIHLMTRSVLPGMVGASEYFANPEHYHDILRRGGVWVDTISLDRKYQEPKTLAQYCMLFAQSPRQMGKTTALYIFAAAYLYACPHASVYCTAYRDDTAKRNAAGIKRCLAYLFGGEDEFRAATRGCNSVTRLRLPKGAYLEVGCGIRSTSFACNIVDEASHGLFRVFYTTGFLPIIRNGNAEKCVIGITTPNSDNLEFKEVLEEKRGDATVYTVDTICDHCLAQPLEEAMKCAHLIHIRPPQSIRPNMENMTDSVAAVDAGAVMEEMRGVMGEGSDAAFPALRNIFEDESKRVTIPRPPVDGHLSRHLYRECVFVGVDPNGGGKDELGCVAEAYLVPGTCADNLPRFAALGALTCGRKESAADKRQAIFSNFLDHLWERYPFRYLVVGTENFGNCDGTRATHQYFEHWLAHTQSGAAGIVRIGHIGYASDGKVESPADMYGLGQTTEKTKTDLWNLITEISKAGACTMVTWDDFVVPKRPHLDYRRQCRDGAKKFVRQIAGAKLIRTRYGLPKFSGKMGGGQDDLVMAFALILEKLHRMVKLHSGIHRPKFVNAWFPREAGFA